MDISINLNDNCERKAFIGNLGQGQEFLDKMDDKSHSNNPTKQAMHRQGGLVGTLESVAKQICPSHHISNHGSPVPKKELNFNCQLPAWLKSPPPLSKSVPTTKKVQHIDIFNAEDPTCVTIPDEFRNAFDQQIADRYVHAISSAATFDTSRPCVVCDKTGHTFDDCPVLQNVEFLCKH